jgi:hypothetical protein
MIGWDDFLIADPIDWLLEEDNPSVRYLTLRTLLDLPEDDQRVAKARRAIMQSGPVPVILAAQHEDGYWVKPGAGYSPKYRSTVWQIIFLADLEADGADPRVAKGCEYLLNNSRAKSGAFSASQVLVPSAAIDCLNGNLIHALQRLGWGQDERVHLALQRLSESVLTHGFECVGNAKLPCAWGAVKAVRALTAAPREERSEEVSAAIGKAAEFLLSRNLAVADYPCTVKVSANWTKFGFPLGYQSNVLETLQALAEAGRGADPQLTHALKLTVAKQDSLARWKMEYSLNGKMWADIEAKGKPSKWVTLQAIQMIKLVYEGY